MPVSRKLVKKNNDLHEIPDII